jgi:hypothetical protein
MVGTRAPSNDSPARRIYIALMITAFCSSLLKSTGKLKPEQGQFCAAVNSLRDSLLFNQGLGVASLSFPVMAGSFKLSFK